MAEQIVVVAPHSEYIGKGCPTCHHGIEEGQTIAICPRCKSLHHEKCWFDKGGCGKVGCTGISSKRKQVSAEIAASNGDSQAAAAANPAIKPVSTEANQMPMGVIWGVVAVVIIVALYLLLR